VWRSTSGISILRSSSSRTAAGPSTLIGASNFFELAVAAAIALFGFQSGAALSTVVGVLAEVPVMLSVVHLVRRSRGCGIKVE
jgi:arsenite transporter